MSDDEPLDPFANTVVITVTRDMDTGYVEVDWDEEQWSADAVLVTLVLAQNILIDTAYWQADDDEEDEEEDDEFL